MTGEESDAAREDLWLTYQNYDPAVKQAVRRLGALPGNNVEEFRSLLLASRERSRVKEFEADVVRRLQGEAFVGDEVLQQTLIVLHAENPQLAEQFKQFVAANGRPDDIDLTVARLRSGTDNPVMPERMPRKPREMPISPVILPEPVAEAPELVDEAPPAAKIPEANPQVSIPEASTPEISRPPDRPALVIPRPAPVAANDTVKDEEPTPGGSWIKRLGAVAALLLIGAGGFLVLMPKSAITEKPAGFQATTAPLRQVAEDRAPAAEPAPAAPVSEPTPNPPAQTAPPTAESLQAGPATAQARNGIQPSAQDAIVPPPAANTANAPVPGSRYRVVKGDMLSVIAQQAYGNPSLYPMIQRANPGLRNANRIFYDQVITLPPKP